MHAAESIKEERDDLRRQKELLQILNDNQAASISDLTCQLERLQAEAAAMRGTIGMADITHAEYQELRDSLGWSRQEKQQLYVENAALRQQLEHSETVAAAWRANTNQLAIELEQSEAEVAEMREALIDIKQSSNPFACGNPITAMLELGAKADTALSTTAGQSILDRLQRAEAVVDAALKHFTASGKCAPTQCSDCRFIFDTDIPSPCERRELGITLAALLTNKPACKGNGCCSRCGEQPSGGDPTCGS